MTPTLSAIDLRDDCLAQAKEFKAGWTAFAQTLYTIHRDKLFHAWGYEDFGHYVEQELGIKKSVAMKMIKVYFFVEQDEPQYLKNSDRDTLQVPGIDALDVLRRARSQKDLTRDDYAKIRKGVFEKGKHEGIAAKELTSIIKERKQVDPDEEREKRANKSINNVVHALHIFTKEMEILKLVPDEIVSESEGLRKKIEREIR